MSGINGDKARFHRQRKAKIARRLRNEERLGFAAAEQKPAAAPQGKSRAKAGKAVSAGIPASSFPGRKRSCW
jgi:hypothetical protein